MKLFSTAAILFLAAVMNFFLPAAAAEPLIIADGTGGMNLNALAFAAAASAKDGEEVSIVKMTPRQALTALQKKEAQLALVARPDIPAGFAAGSIHTYAWAALYFYISPSRKISSVSLAELRRWWSEPRPVWYKGGFDIQRVASRETWLEKRFFRAAEAIYRPAVPGSHIANAATLFCAASPGHLDVNQQLLAVDSVMPTAANIQSGRYPLGVEYVIVSAGKPTAQCERLFAALRHRSVYQLLHNAALIPPPLQ